MPEREGLVERIRQVRRLAGAPARGPSGAGRDDVPIDPHALEARIEHLERLVEALQDSVHRESERLEKRIAELEDRIQPAALGIALSEDARKRGL